MQSSVARADSARRLARPLLRLRSWVGRESGCRLVLKREDDVHLSSYRHRYAVKEERLVPPGLDRVDGGLLQKRRPGDNLKGIDQSGVRYVRLKHDGSLDSRRLGDSRVNTWGFGEQVGCHHSRFHHYFVQHRAWVSCRTGGIVATQYPSHDCSAAGVRLNISGVVQMDDGQDLDRLTVGEGWRAVAFFNKATAWGRWASVFPSTGAIP